MADDLDRARRRRQEKRAVRPGGTGAGPGGRQQVTINRVLAKVDAAAESRDPAAFYAGQFPTPERITAALNLRMLYGPEVDKALGGEEPMVDEWESADRTPTFEDMQRLAELTGFPVRFFYLPPGPPVGDAFLCGPSGCETLGGEIAEDGDDTGRLF